MQPRDFIVLQDRLTTADAEKASRIAQLTSDGHKAYLEAVEGSGPEEQNTEQKMSCTTSQYLSWTLAM